jgi:hypothetical protein
VLRTIGDNKPEFTNNLRAPPISALSTLPASGQFPASVLGLEKTVVDLAFIAGLFAFFAAFYAFSLACNRL